MASDKSLAAEIEAVLNADNVDMPRGCLVTVDASAVSLKIAARIAALQSRAFEDGARKSLSDALAAYDAAERNLNTATAVYEEHLNREDPTPDIGEIMDRVGAQEACMRRSMAQKIAHSNLIDAVRDALQPEGERSDA